MKELYGKAAVLCIAMLLLTAFFVGRLLPYLKRRRVGQHILEIGPSWHAVKEGTPTMGGIAFLPAALIVAIGYAAISAATGREVSFQFLALLAYAVLCGLVGLADDMMKHRGGKNKGLSAPQKYLLQLLVSAVFLYYLRATGAVGTAVRLPFSAALLELGVLYDLFALLFLTGMMNALNLTDGLDGLLSASVAVTAGFLLLWGALWQSAFLLFAGAVILGCALGFLLYNAHPARVFMGDTGSLFLGGAVAGVGIMAAHPFAVMIAGGVFVLEAASVVLQVVWFRLSHGKRLFLMAPLHHHLEKRGLGENAIVALAASAGVLFLSLALLALLGGSV